MSIAAVGRRLSHCCTQHMSCSYLVCLWRVFLRGDLPQCRDAFVTAHVIKHKTTCVRRSNVPPATELMEFGEAPCRSEGHPRWNCCHLAHLWHCSLVSNSEVLAEVFKCARLCDTGALALLSNCITPAGEEQKQNIDVCEYSICSI